jgi:hypothetical protein
VETLISHLESNGYDINYDQNDWNHGNPKKAGIHINDVYNTLKCYGYKDDNLTEGEVSIPLDAIETLVVKRVVKANVEPAPESYVSIKNPIGEQVLEPLDGSDEYAWDIISGGRTVTDEYYISWDVGRDGRITGRTPYAGYPELGPLGRFSKIVRSVNQLNQMQQRGQTPAGIRRFDKGDGSVNKPYDEVHFFGSESSLYRNGTWRHNKNNHQLTRDQIKFLQENGWTIPK